MRTLTRTFAGAAVLSLAFSTLCLAQSAPATPAHNSAVLIHIKADMINEWMDLQKNELNPALKKAGVKTRTIYRTVLGNTNEFLIVTPLEKYAELDAMGASARALGAEGAARLNAKLAKCTEDRQAFISNPLPELSNVTSDTPALVVYTRRRVASGKMQEFQNIIKTQFLPLYKKAGEGYTVSRRGLGANNNDVVTSVPLKKAADLDAGPLPTRVLGADGALKLNNSLAAISTMVEQIVRRRIPELSF